MTEFTKRAIMALIETYQDATAPLILGRAHTSLNQLGKLLASASKEPDTAQSFRELLLSKWTDEELDALSTKPEFLLALISFLLVAIERYTRNLVHDV